METKNCALCNAVSGVRKITEKAIDVLSVALMTMIFVLGLAQVIWRWVLNDPITWSEELIQLTYVWICYLGWALATRNDSHIRITNLMNALPKNGQKWLQIFCHVLVIVFSVLMVFYGFKLFKNNLNRVVISLPWLNYATVYAMGPLMNLVIIFYEIAGIVECFVKGPKDYTDVGGEE